MLQANVKPAQLVQRLFSTPKDSFELDPILQASNLMEHSSQFLLQMTRWSARPSLSLIQDGNTDCAVGGSMKTGDLLQKQLNSEKARRRLRNRVRHVAPVYC